MLVFITLLALTLNGGEKLGRINMEDALKRNGFIAIKSSESHFPAIYKKIKNQNEPMYITIDPLLHGVHLIYDFTLRTLETEQFYSDLKTMLLKLDSRFRELKNVKNRHIKETSLTNLAYVEVALKLLDPKFSLDKDVKDVVEAEINLISEHAGFDTSRVLKVFEDYSQYVPRGHYTRTDTLKRYFLSMMWLGRMPFYIFPDTENLDRNIFLTRCAILMAQAISEDSEIQKLYERIYEITSYLVGKSDDLNFVELIPLIEKQFPDFPVGFSDDSQILNFMKKASKLRKPSIYSTWFRDIDNPEEILLSCKFMSQRFIPDSYIFQNLVYAKVGTASKPRLFPRGLDLLAVLGNDRAKDILLNFYNEGQYKNYTKMLDSLQKWAQAIKIEEWHQNAYWHWLYIIKTLNETPRFPPFLKVNVTAYRDKLLITQQGFWAELRHDTILYAKQSYTARVTGIRPEPVFPDVIVEPVPQSYREIIRFLESFKNKLVSYDFKNETISEKIEELKELTEMILEACELQTANKKLPLNKAKYLYSFGEILERIYTFPSSFTQNEEDTLLPLIADVHTDVNSGLVLEVAVGFPLELYIQGDGKIFKGAMFSYYEFKQPMKDRLTDKEWQEKANSVPFEKWISFIAE
ncbi:MAG: DUF3160 domain-containing protein [bacterium]|nr:DUF3160 domain-containing protein [bacterium]